MVGNIDKIIDTTYLVYGGACGTGGILTKAERRIMHLAKTSGKKQIVDTYMLSLGLGGKR